MEKIYFNPGDVVIVRHEDLLFRPVMVVLKKKDMQIRRNKSDFAASPGSTLKLESVGEGRLLGIECFWFDEHGQYCEQLFNTKDLKHFEEGDV